VYRYRNLRVAPARRPAPPHDADTEVFRDAPTLLCYGALAGYAYWLYAYGPALALLRSELHFSYTLLGVYSAIWSAGAALAGVSFAPVARRLPRAPLLWSSMAGATAGIALFTATRTVALTLTGAAITGFAGTVLLTCIQAILSDRHGERRDQALVEANVGAAGCAVLAPLLLGLFQATPLGWRAALALPVLLLAGLYLRYRHQPLPPPPPVRPTGQQARLSRSCWLLAAMVAVGIAIEFCPIYFGTEVLTSTGLRTAEAATAMSGFYLGILLSRIGGAYLIRRAGRTVPLLCVSLAVTTAGFGLFWLAGQPALAIAGLTVCGVGLANLYPLSLALTLAAAPGNGDTANARTQLLGGILVIAAPYLLGTLADHFGLRAAFTIEPVLIGAAALLLAAGLRLARPASLRQRRELAVVVYQRPAGRGMPGRDHPPQDERVVSDGKVARQREQQPGQDIIEHGQAECVTMPARSRTELRRVRPAETAREVRLAVGEQVDHDMPGRLDGSPGRRTQANTERHDRRHKRDRRERSGAEPDGILRTGSDDGDSLGVVAHRRPERIWPGRERGIVQPSLNVGPRDCPLRTVVGVRPRRKSYRFHDTCSGCLAWAIRSPVSRSSVLSLISSAYGELLPGPYAFRWALQSATAPLMSPSACRLTPRR
jgi:MFS family permease